MNVLFVTHYASMYGANRSLLALLDNAENYGIKPFVICPQEGDFINELKNRNIPHQIIPFKNWMAKTRYKALLRLLWNLFVLPFMFYKIKKWDVKHIHTNSSVTPIGAWLAFLGGLSHTWHIREFGWEDYKLKYDFGKGFFNYWLNKSDHIIAISESIKDNVLNKIDAPVSVIYNGVISRQEAQKIDRSLTIKERVKVFGIVGLLNPVKGQEQAIKAFAQYHDKYPNSTLLVAGSGKNHYVNFLKKLSENLGIIDNVRFLGFVNEPFKFYSTIDVALICSKFEGMGRVTAEAMIAGKVVIGRDSGGTSELIENGKNGFLYDGSVDSLTKMMINVSEIEVSELGQNARETALNNYINEDYANKVITVIINAFKNKRDS